MFFLTLLALILVMLGVFIISFFFSLKVYVYVPDPWLTKINIVLTLKSWKTFQLNKHDQKANHVEVLEPKIWWLEVFQSNRRYSAEHLLSGHPRGNGKWPLSRGWPLNKGSSEINIGRTVVVWCDTQTKHRHVIRTEAMTIHSFL